MCSRFRCEFRAPCRHQDAPLLLTAQPAGLDTTPQHRAGGNGRNAAMASRICWNRSRDTMTSAIWNVIGRPCWAIFAPIFTSRSREMVIDQRLTASGKVSVRRTLARLYARASPFPPGVWWLICCGCDPGDAARIAARIDPTQFPKSRVG
jgi:hypothetical protein